MTVAQIMEVVAHSGSRLVLEGDTVWLETVHKAPGWLVSELQRKDAELKHALRQQLVEPEVQTRATGRLRPPRGFTEIPSNDKPLLPPTGVSVFHRLRGVGPGAGW